MEEKTGNFSVQLERLEEIAEKNDGGKGSEGLITPQKYFAAGDFFSDCCVGGKGKLRKTILSKYDQDSYVWRINTGFLEN